MSGVGGDNILIIIIYFLCLIQGLYIHKGGRGEGFKGFIYDWEFHKVTLNDATSIWFMVSQEKRIHALRFFQSCHFKHGNGVRKYF